jgi:hypothetical protein
MNRANYEKQNAGRTFYGPENYRKAQSFLRLLRLHKTTLTRQEVLTLRCQALAGDIEGAEAGLDKIILGHERRDLQIGRAEA